MGATYRADTIIVGGGLAGLATALELLDTGQSVVLVDVAPRERLGGLARQAFGGIFVVGTSEQRRAGFTDTPDLALEDWTRYGELTDTESWPHRWAQAYVHGSRPDVYDWLRGHGVRFFPVVHWVERGHDVPGNSVPRFHMVWGTGRRLVDVVLSRIAEHAASSRLLILARHRVTEMVQVGGRITGVAGEQLRERDGELVVAGSFRAEGDAVVVAAGGVCGDLDGVRRRWPAGYGTAPRELLNGSHPAADGTLHDAAATVGAQTTHLDRVWFYAAGVRHWRPRHEDHALSLVPPRSALWVNWCGERFEPPLVGGQDTSALVKRICAEAKQHSWLVLNARIARRELAVSGAEFNPAMRDRQALRFVLTQLLGNRKLVGDLIDNCPDFVAADTVDGLAERMRDLDGNDDIDPEVLAAAIASYDATAGNESDDQRRRIAAARTYRGDRVRTCKAARIDDPRGRPLIAIRARVTTRKSLGGLQTDLGSRVLGRDGEPMPGLLAVGEAAGFGGGGFHGSRSLEGTFLGGCIFTARAAARTIASG